ncbi:MAG TPA: hypothetical protein VGV63_08145 [Acidimicrobiales bacterium]|nr:hypothetical protein [Acidimicrobiales bacterium]
MLRRLLTVGAKLGLLLGMVALVVQAVQRRANPRRGPSAPPPWPPLDVDDDHQRPPVAAPATAEFSLPATEEEVIEAGRATEHEASELQQRLATTPIKAAVRAESLPSPKPPGPTDATWVQPDDGACPASHPVKAKLRSRVFHLPGMAHYDRTNADRCYRDGAAAEGDGFRQAKR